MDKMRGEGVKKCMFFFGGGKKWPNSVHVVVECPLRIKKIKNQILAQENN